MKSMQSAFAFVLAGAAPLLFVSCTHTVEETRVVHYQYHHHYAHERARTSTAPQDYGVVNQYDRMSR